MPGYLDLGRGRRAAEEPWAASDKLHFVKISDNVDYIEMMNSATEAQAVAAAFRAERALERQAAPGR